MSARKPDVSVQWDTRGNGIGTRARLGPCAFASGYATRPEMICQRAVEPAGYARAGQGTHIPAHRKNTFTRQPGVKGRGSRGSVKSEWLVDSGDIQFQVQ